MTRGTTSGSNSSTSEGYSDSDSYSSSESEADIPIFVPTPFEELSSVQYYSLDEQLTELTAALKQQFQRHCFIQIRQQETQPMLVPFVEPVTTFTYNRAMLDFYIQQQHQRQRALSSYEIAILLAKQESSLLEAAAPSISMPRLIEASGQVIDISPMTLPATSSIWNRAPFSQQPPILAMPIPRKRGPKADSYNHDKVVSIVQAFGEAWTTDDNLMERCEELDRQKVPVSKTWATRSDGVAHTWTRGRHHYHHLVIKAIKDRLKAASGEA